MISELEILIDAIVDFKKSSENVTKVKIWEAFLKSDLQTKEKSCMQKGLKKRSLLPGT